MFAAPYFSANRDTGERLSSIFVNSSESNNNRTDYTAKDHDKEMAQDHFCVSHILFDGDMH